MAVEIRLLRDDRVFVGQYEGQLTAEDVNMALKKLGDMLEKASAPVHNIGDFSRVTKYPPNLLSFARHHRNLISHPRMGRVIAVTRSTFFTAMLNAILRIIPSINLKLVGTMEEAIAEIDRVLAAESQAKTT